MQRELLLTIAITGAVMLACQKSSLQQPEEEFIRHSYPQTDLSLDTRGSIDSIEFIYEEIDSVIPVKVDSSLLNQINQRKARQKKLMQEANNLSTTLFDIRDMPVNIINSNSTYDTFLTAKRRKYRKWFKTHYATATAEFLQNKTDRSDTQSQTFYITASPYGTYQIKTSFNNTGDHYMTPGSLSSDPSNYVLYASSSYMSESDFEFKCSDDEHFQIESILVGCDDPDNPTPYNVWNYSLESLSMKSHFSKYNNLATQKFTIMPEEEFIFDRIEYDLEHGAETITRIPDFVTYQTLTNRTSIQQSYTATFSNKAVTSSSFSNNIGVSLKTNKEISILVPKILDSLLSLSGSYSRTWGKNETVEDSRSYSFPIIAPPYTKIVASANVKRYQAQVNYITYFKGKTSGREVRIYGQWEGIDCNEINYTIEEYDLNSTKIRKKYFIKTSKK